MESTGRPDVEHWAVEILAEALASTGRTLRVTRRPDRENRTTRSVDFEAVYEGRTVAIEVTQLAPSMSRLGPASAFMRMLVGAVRSALASRVSGFVVLDVGGLNPPTKRHWDRARQSLVDAVSQGIEVVAERREVMLSVDPGLADEVRLVRIGDEPDHFGAVWATRGTGGQLSGLAEAWLQGLASRKRSQTDGYGEVWILIVDLELLLDDEDLSLAINRLRSELPRNWKRFLFIPATDRTKVIDLSEIAAA